MKSAVLLLAVLLSPVAQAAEINYVAYSLKLRAVKALKAAFPVCEKAKVVAKENEGSTDFEISLACRRTVATPKDAVNDSVVITITGTSAPWGELGNIEVKVGTFCAGNCEN